ncbi:hypothetical protein ACOMHN_049003 [Nucella lapillus]
MEVSPTTRRCLLMLLVVALRGVHAFRMDTHSTGQKLAQVTVDPDSGEVFVGGSNTLLYLSSNLSQPRAVSLGPVLDSLHCDPSAGPCSEGQLADNKVKVLEVDQRRRQLLVCGSVRQGLCHVRSLTNISVHVNASSTFLPNYVGGKKSVAVLLNETSLFPSTLYVGQEYDDRLVSLSPNVLSSRRVEIKPKGVNITFTNYNVVLGQISALDIHPSLKGNYHMEFVDIFGYGNFIYFITVQQKSIQDPNSPYPRIGRICVSDQVYVSYVEMALVCQVSDSEQFPKILSTTVSDGILYFSAARGKDGSRERFETDPVKGSVVCAVSMSEVNSHFMQVNYDCFSRASSVQIPAWKTGRDGAKCTASSGGVNVTLQVPRPGPDFCGHSANWGIQTKPDSYQSFRKFMVKVLHRFEKEVVTTVSSTRQSDHTVLVLGTNTGRVMKMETTGSSVSGRIYMTHQLSNAPVEKDAAFDPDHSHLYLLAGTSVHRFPVSSCAVHADCGSCLKSKDPLACGWCQDTCTTQADCPPPKRWTDPQAFKPTPSCPPIVQSVSPQSGPVVGGTVLTIHGSNFGHSDIAIRSVSVGNTSCVVQNILPTVMMCEVQPAPKQGQGYVSVNVLDTSHSEDRPYYVNGSDISQDLFSFKRAAVTQYHPSQGPRSGGTNITVEGAHLDIGSSASVHLGQQSCRLYFRSSSEIRCTTSAESPKDVRLKVAIDNQDLTPISPFRFLPDPTISDLSPRRAFVSGGIQITMRGSNLHAAQRPMLRAMYKKREIQTSEVCKASANGSVLLCPALNVKQTLALIISPPETMDIYMQLDGATLLQNNLLSHFQYFPDPHFFPFTETGKLRMFDVSKKELELQVGWCWL